MKYITSIGQNTGMLKQSNKVNIMATIVDFVTEYQNLNSGNLLINGLNSSFDLVGNSGPSPSIISFEVNINMLGDSDHVETEKNVSISCV